MKNAASFETMLLNSLGQIHWRAVGMIFGIALFGLAMMLSAGGGAVSPWAAPQMLRFAVGFIAMLVIAVIPVHLLLRHAYNFYLFCLLILIAVEVMGFMGKGAQRWVAIGFFQLQPSELMKVALIMALARYFHNLHPDQAHRVMSLLPPLVLVALPAAFILRQPNLGTTTILVGVAAIVFFMAGVRLRYFAMAALAAGAALPIGWHFLHDYQKQRVMTFLDPTQDPLGAGYNILQSIIAIGSGGLMGKGYLNGSQGQLNFLPEKHTDFIFTMVAEEFGFAGSVALILAYGLLIAYAVGIALRCKSTFGTLLSIGVAALVLIHLLINMAMVMGMLPVVGVPLPLLSYGGTMMMTILAAFGLMLNAHVHRDTAVPREAY